MMSGVQEMKGLLFEELELIVETTSNLIRKISPEDWSYQPRENMNTLQQLVQHLVSVPKIDLLIIQEGTEQAVHQLEAEIKDEQNVEKLIAWMNDGFAELKVYMEGLSDDDFLHKRGIPFYLEHGTIQAKWLIEVVTHAQHHRAQLFNYLKQLGYEVNMFDLY